MKQKGRPAKIPAEHLEILRALAQAHPLATLGELIIAFREQTGITVHSATLSKGLAEAGVARVKPARSQTTEAEATSASKRYGYQERHRPQNEGETYSSSLTDAEWALVKDLFEREGRGLPPRIARRRLVDACCYVVRTGCAWRLLPKDFPHWDNVYKTFRRWSAQGRYEAMHDRLRSMWRVREERETAPTAAILDAQSTRSSPQGGASGYDAGKKVQGRKRNLVLSQLSFDGCNRPTRFLKPRRSCSELKALRDKIKMTEY